jgi:glyceraldehyde-3-phosphate dehydrogenase/erythrose-4-phosphate dehydrogenase
MCKKIHRAGNAEQYHADKKYKEAVAEAVEACAEDTKGQTCYICTQALHWKTKEGLVRGCSCRGTAGFAHVSCLAEQAKILCDEADAISLYTDDASTLDDLREAVTILEETERTARRVLGGAHPLTSTIEGDLRDARSALRARETPPGSA